MQNASSYTTGRFAIRRGFRKLLSNISTPSLAIVIHQYDNLNLHIIWNFLTKERPLIKKAAEDCLKDIDSQNVSE